METGWQRCQRKKQKKAEMLRLCRLLDVKDWDKNEQVTQEVQSIIQKEEKVKNKGTSRSKDEEKKTQEKRKKIKSQKAKETNEVWIVSFTSLIMFKS